MMFGAQFLGGMPSAVPGGGFGPGHAQPQPQALQPGNMNQYQYSAPPDMNDYIRQVMLYNMRMFHQGQTFPLPGSSFNMGTMTAPASAVNPQQPMSASNSGNLNMSGPIAPSSTSAATGVSDHTSNAMPNPAIAPASIMANMAAAWPPGAGSMLGTTHPSMFQSQQELANLNSLNAVGGMAGLPGLNPMENLYGAGGPSPGMLGMGAMQGQAAANPLGVLPLMGAGMAGLHNPYLNAAGLLPPMQVPSGAGLHVGPNSAAGMSMSMLSGAMLHANALMGGHLPLGLAGMGAGMMGQAPTQQQLPPPQPIQQQPPQLQPLQQQQQPTSMSQQPSMAHMQHGMGMTMDSMALAGMPPLAIMGPGMLNGNAVATPNGGPGKGSSGQLYMAADPSNNMGDLPGIGVLNAIPGGWGTPAMTPTLAQVTPAPATVQHVPLPMPAPSASGKKGSGGRARSEAPRSDDADRNDDDFDSSMSSAQGDDQTSDMDDAGGTGQTHHSMSNMGPLSVGMSMGMGSQSMHPDVNEKEAKKLKRKQSNRDSARRSRLRKQAELNDVVGMVENMNSTNTDISTQVQSLTHTAEQLDAANAVLRELLSVVRSCHEATGGRLPSPGKLKPYLERLKRLQVEEEPSAATGADRVDGSAADVGKADAGGTEAVSGGKNGKSRVRAPSVLCAAGAWHEAVEEGVELVSAKSVGGRQQREVSVPAAASEVSPNSAPSQAFSAADVVARQKAAAAMAAIANARKGTTHGYQVNMSGSSHAPGGPGMLMDQSSRMQAGSPVTDHMLYSRRNLSMNAMGSAAYEVDEDNGGGRTNNSRDSALELSTGLQQTGRSGSYSSDNDYGLPVVQAGKGSESNTDNASAGAGSRGGVPVQDLMGSGSDGMGADGGFGMGTDEWADAAMVDVGDGDGPQLLSVKMAQAGSGYPTYDRVKHRQGSGVGAVAAVSEGHVRP